MTSRKHITMILAAAVVAVSVLGAAAPAAHADSIALHATAFTPGSVVTLKDIAVLEGDYAKSLGDLTVAKIDGAADKTITSADVHARLDEQNANWGKLLLRGSTSVRVHHGDSPSAPIVEKTAAKIVQRHAPEIIIDEAISAAANPLPAVDADAAMNVTLRRKLTDWIRTQVGPEGELQITFDADQDATLSRMFGTQRLEIEPQTRGMLGRLPIVIRCYDRDRLTESLRVRADVKVRREVVVAKKPLTRGQIVAASDVELKSELIDSVLKTPVTNLATTIGSRATAATRPGSILYSDDVAAALLVERGQLVTVRCISGAVVLKTVARAMTEGASGQFITVRNERTRQDYQARVCGPQEAVLTSDLPASPLASKEAVK